MLPASSNPTAPPLVKGGAEPELAVVRAAGSPIEQEGADGAMAIDTEAVANAIGDEELAAGSGVAPFGSRDQRGNIRTSRSRDWPAPVRAPHVPHFARLHRSANAFIPTNGVFANMSYPADHGPQGFVTHRATIRSNRTRSSTPRFRCAAICYAEHWTPFSRDAANYNARCARRAGMTANVTPANHGARCTRRPAIDATRRTASGFALVEEGRT